MKVAGNAVVVGMIFAAIVAAGILTGGRDASRSPRVDSAGCMAEVVVKADMPRLVTDTVYVRAVRSVAAVPAPSFVN